MDVLALDREEVANSLTHGLGLALSAGGAGVLLVYASWFGSIWDIVSCSIYSASLVVLYTASTLYHSARTTRYKSLFKVIDHVAIFLLIAGTYTPFALGPLRESWGWLVFGLIWACALFGIGFKLFSKQRFREVTTVFYVIMGWLAVLFIKPMVEALPTPALLLIAAGGVFYTGGVYFYLHRRMPFAHAVWHLFVLAGSACHYLAILCFVVPRA